MKKTAWPGGWKLMPVSPLYGRLLAILHFLEKEEIF